MDQMTGQGIGRTDQCIQSYIYIKVSYQATFSFSHEAQKLFFQQSSMFHGFSLSSHTKTPQHIMDIYREEANGYPHQNKNLKTKNKELLVYKSAI